MGSIYLRGDTYWLKYYRNGKPYRESSMTKKETEAKRLLKKREGEIAIGKIPGVYFDRITFDELAKDFLADYRINGKKSLVRAKRSVNHLNEAFAGYKVSQLILLRHINDYGQINNLIRYKAIWCRTSGRDDFCFSSLCLFRQRAEERTGHWRAFHDCKTLELIGKEHVVSFPASDATGSAVRVFFPGCAGASNSRKRE